MIKRILNSLPFRKKSAGRSYFDYPAKEKKRIIKRALHESSKMQLDLLERYEKRYSFNKVQL